MTLHDYCSKSGKDLILDYVNSLPEDEKTDGLSVMECMEKGEFDKIRFKRWEKKVYEVYFQKHNRIFYITVDKENIYLLHACRKQKNKTEKTDKKLVRKRASELGKQLGKTFGDQISVKLWEDKEERIVEIPEDVMPLFEKNPKAFELYEKMSYTHKKEYMRWITDAKKPETRENRKSKMIEMILAGKKGI